MVSFPVTVGLGLRGPKHTNGNGVAAGLQDTAGGLGDEDLDLGANAGVVTGLAVSVGSGGVIDAGHGAGGDDGDVGSRGDGHEGGKGDSGVLHLV